MRQHSACNMASALRGSLEVLSLLALRMIVLHDLVDKLGIELALLIVAVGLPDGDIHHVEDAGGLLEDVVHLLQGTTTRLGEEEVDKGEDKCVAVIITVSFKSGTSGHRPAESYMTAKMI